MDPSTIIELFLAKYISRVQSQVALGSTWEIARIVFETLNPMVKRCILNQARGYQLLLDILFVIFSICIQLHRDYLVLTTFNLPFKCQDFEDELKILHVRMGLEVNNVLNLFLSFIVTFNPTQACNTCVPSNQIFDSKAFNASWSVLAWTQQV